MHQIAFELACSDPGYGNAGAHRGVRQQRVKRHGQH